MATYTYDGEPLTFPTIFKVDGTQLVAEPGETYELAEEIDDPRFTSVGSAKSGTPVVAPDAPSIASETEEPAGVPVPSKTPLDSPESVSEQENA